MRTLGPATADPLVLAVRSALIDAARHPGVRRQRGERDISMGGYQHVYGDAQDLAEVAVEVLRETLADRLSDFVTPPSSPVPLGAGGAVAKNSRTAVDSEKGTRVSPKPLLSVEPEPRLPNPVYRRGDFLRHVDTDGLPSIADEAVEKRPAEFKSVETDTPGEGEEIFLRDHRQDLALVNEAMAALLDLRGDCGEVGLDVPSDLLSETISDTSVPATSLRAAMTAC